MDKIKACSKHMGWLLGEADVRGFRQSYILPSKLGFKSCNTHLFNPKWFFEPLQGKAFPRARPQADDGITSNKPGSYLSLK